METLIHADIFFFITTIAVVIFLILGSICFYYVIKILGNIKRASDQLEKEVDRLGDNVDSLYHTIKESFIFNLIFKKKRGK
jgi:hypothetical protein